MLMTGLLCIDGAIHNKENTMLLMKLDGSGTVLIDAVESRLKQAVEYAQAGEEDKAEELFANALEAENAR
jgi:hypothetical protein